MSHLAEKPVRTGAWIYDLLYRVWFYTGRPELFAAANVRKTRYLFHSRPAFLGDL